MNNPSINGKNNGASSCIDLCLNLFYDTKFYSTLKLGIRFIQLANKWRLKKSFGKIDHRLTRTNRKLINEKKITLLAFFFRVKTGE